MSSKDMHGVQQLCELEYPGWKVPKAWHLYIDVVAEWSERIDLVSRTEAPYLAEILFLDALHILKQDWLGGQGRRRLIDVGAGVGAPTLPLLLALPELEVVLVEPRRKRTAFLRHSIGVFDFADRASVVEDKIDPQEPKIVGTPFDVALSRATFTPELWLELGCKLADTTLAFVAREEPLKTLRQGAKQMTDYKVPSSAAPRSLLLF